MGDGDRNRRGRGNRVLDMLEVPCSEYRAFWICGGKGMHGYIVHYTHVMVFFGLYITWGFLA